MMNLKLIFDMAELYKKKQEDLELEALKQKLVTLQVQHPETYMGMKAEDIIEKRYYPNQNHNVVFMGFQQIVEMNSLNESEVTFLIDTKLDLVSYKMDFPVLMGITLIIQEDKEFLSVDGKNQYKGLIHSIGEMEKKEIRKYVNEIFFSALNEEREKELEAFKALNQNQAADRATEMESEADEAIKDSQDNTEGA